MVAFSIPWGVRPVIGLAFAHVGALQRPASITALGALLQEKRHLDPERFGGDKVE